MVVSAKSAAEMLRELLPRMRELRVSDALGPVRRALRESGTDVALLDANYVCSEGEIYKKAGAAR